MKIAVIGGTGMVGSRVVSEAASRGHTVTSVARRGSAAVSPQVTPIVADASRVESIEPVLAQADAVVLSVRSEQGAEGRFLNVTDVVLGTAARTATRVVVVGGAGPLRSPNQSDRLVADDPAFVPAEWRFLALASTAQLRVCERHPQTKWTYVSPPALLVPGSRTGTFRRGSDTLLVGADGTSSISAEDFAIAIVDECENASGEPHITVGY